MWKVSAVPAPRNKKKQDVEKKIKCCKLCHMRKCALIYIHIYIYNSGLLSHSAEPWHWAKSPSYMWAGTWPLLLTAVSQLVLMPAAGSVCVVFHVWCWCSYSSCSPVLCFIPYMPDAELSLGFKVLFIAVLESEKLQPSPLQLSCGIGSVAVSYI